MVLISNINFYFDCDTRLCLIVPSRQEKIFLHKKVSIFAQESFYLQGILDDINEQVTSFLDCKHKHMMKSGAPPDKFGVLYRMVAYRIPWFHKQNSKGYHSLVPGLISIFLETVWVPLISIFWTDQMNC